MYRDPAERSTREAPPVEFVFAPAARSERRIPGLAALQTLALPGVVGAALSVYAGPGAGFAGLVGSTALGVYLWRRRPRTGFVLRIEGGRLSVTPRGARKVGPSVALSDLHDVVLETMTIQPVVEGASAIPAMRFVQAQAGPEVDTARVVLVHGDGKRTRLGEHELAHMEASEWFGKLRVFLRKHGWLPPDEREPPPSSSIG